MRNIIALPRSDAQVRREAAAWLARLDGADASGQELPELRAWLDQDSRHVKALVEMARLWDAMDCMAVIAEMIPAGAPGRSPRQRLYGPGAVAVLASVFAAVALLALALGGVLDAPGRHHQSEPQELVYRTGIGQQSEISLRDGSVLTLNTATEVRVRYQTRERAVLLASGEAYFQVAKNPDIPFVVYARSGQVRALGTAFSVRLREQGVEVLVDEGQVKVELTAKEAPVAEGSGVHAVITTAQKTVTLGQGGRVGYDNTLGEPGYLTGDSKRQALAWRTGRWAFSGETLGEVVDEVSRYTHRQIEIVDPEIIDLRIGGYFDIGEIDAFLAALESGFGVSVTSVSDSHIQLSVRDKGAVQ